MKPVHPSTTSESATPFACEEIPVRVDGVKFYRLLLSVRGVTQVRWVVELSAAFTHTRAIVRQFTNELHARAWLADLLQGWKPAFPSQSEEFGQSFRHAGIIHTG